MRKKVYEIRDIKAIVKLLESAIVGRLASVGTDGFPVITPLNYVFWQGSVYFHSALEGEKLDNIQRDNRVCFEVDFPLSYLGLGYGPKRPTCEVTQLYQSVVIRGFAEIVQDVDEKLGALNALMTSHEQDDSFAPVTEEDKGFQLCHVVAIRPDLITAKANVGQKMTEQERKEAAAYLEKKGLPGDKDAAALLRGRNW